MDAQRLEVIDLRFLAGLSLLFFDEPAEASETVSQLGLQSLERTCQLFMTTVEDMYYAEACVSCDHWTCIVIKTFQFFASSSLHTSHSEGRPH